MTLVDEDEADLSHNCESQGLPIAVEETPVCADAPNTEDGVGPTFSSGGVSVRGSFCIY